jgi:hypothetical protein
LRASNCKRREPRLRDPLDGRIEPLHDAFIDQLVFDAIGPVVLLLLLDWPKTGDLPA